MGIEWIDYIIGIHNGSISHDEDSDVLKWSYNKYFGDIATKLAYEMLHEYIPYIQKWWHSFWY